jgi:hypothetical protein
MHATHWNEQLLVSLNHHASCEGVAQIQVIWCNTEEDPPLSVVNHPSGKAAVDQHTVNSQKSIIPHITKYTYTYQGYIKLRQWCTMTLSSLGIMLIPFSTATTIKDYPNGLKYQMT